MNRGDRRESILKDDIDITECCAKTDWQMHTLCLMPIRFPQVVETPKANLVAG